MKKTLIIVLIFFSIALFLYFSFLFILPAFLNSNFFIKKLQTKYGFIIKGYNFKTRANLDILLNFENFKLKEILELKNAKIKYNPLTKFQETTIDYLFLDVTPFLNKKSNKKFNFNFDNLKNTKVKQAVVVIKTPQTITFNIKDFKTISVDDVLRAYFILKVKSEILKFQNITGQKGSLILNKRNLGADNLEIVINRASLFVNGDIINKKGPDLNFKTQNFPIGDTERLILYFMKLKNKKKQFLENFKNFKGTMDVDLTFKNKGITGKIKASDLEAKTVLYNIPILFKKAEFDFLDKKITSKNKGLFAGQSTLLELNYDNLFTNNLEIFGSIKGHLTQDFAKKYVKDLDIINYVDITLNFYNKHKKPDINYVIDLNKNSNIIYKNISVADKNSNRKLFIKTHKENNFLKIKEYTYFNCDNKTKILFGDALFKKKNGKMKLENLNLNAPAYVLITIKPYFKGLFKGNLTFDFNQKRAFGNFILKEALYKNFYITKAQTVITKAKQKSGDLWKTSIDEISYDKFKIKNVLITATLKNEIFNFELQNKDFAKGTLFSKGCFNTKNNDINAYFEALDIDSNIIASEYFNLKNQIEGRAYAVFCANITNNFKNIQADIKFELKQGKLLKLANTDFIFKQSNKNKHLLLKLINISNNDLEKLQAITSDITGSFKLDNHILKCINIKVKQDFLSLLLEGTYDIDKEYADLNLWAKMNKELTKNIKIIFIPANWIINIIFKSEKTLDLYKNKIEQIPPVVAKVKDIVYYRIKARGNINTDNIDIRLKRLVK